MPVARREPLRWPNFSRALGQGPGCTGAGPEETAVEGGSMHTPKSLLTAVVLTLTITGPAAMAAVGSGSAGDQAKKNNHGNGGQSGQHGGNGGGNSGGNTGGSGEDLTHMRFAGMDTNHDGQITRDEWRGNDVSFNQHDWNGDGVLSGIEVTPGVQRPVDFSSLDRNHDSRRGLREGGDNTKNCNRLDTNHDNFLTWTEFSTRGHH